MYERLSLASVNFYLLCHHLLAGGVVLYYLPDSNALVYSANISPARPKNEPAYSLSTHPSDRFQLLPEEVVLHVNWHPSALFFALITSHRALLLDKDLTLLSSFVFPTNHTRPFCSNALWAGAALLLSITTHVVYMTLDGTVRPLASLEQPGAVLMAVFNDKIVYATSNRTNTEIRAQPIGLLEPLVSGQLAYDAWRRTPSAVTAVHLSRIISRFDCARVSEQVYNSLQQAGFPDAAASLLAAAPSPPANALYNAAVNALRFDLAYTLQKEKKVPDITISELGRACVAYGQFETARRVYELSGNFLALLQLYGSCGNRPGVEMLLERAKKDEALKSYIPVVERVLKIRVCRFYYDVLLSSNVLLVFWIFSNFDAIELAHPICSPRIRVRHHLIEIVHLLLAFLSAPPLSLLQS